MSEEDLQQMRQIIREQVETLRADFTPRLGDATEALRADFTPRLDRTLEILTVNLSDLREEITRRFDTLYRRLDRVETNVIAIQHQTAGMSKSLTDAERLDSAMVVTQAAQQRAIDQLAARVTRLERELHPGEQ